MKQTINVGLIGYGFAGSTFHAPIITSVPGLNLKKVVERRSEKSKERYPWVEVVNHVDKLYEDPTIDLIVITTPSTDHFQFVKDALLSGKHVIVEKPFTTTTEEADELIQLANETGKMLSVYHNRRWDGDFMTVSKIVKNNWLGDIKSASLRWEGFDPIAKQTNWRDGKAQGSGVFYDLGVHLLDQVCCLFGEPHSLYADIGVERDGGIADDYFKVDLYYEDSLKVHLSSSKIVKKESPRYTIHGTKGSFIKYGMDPQECDLIAGKSPQNIHGWGKESSDIWGTIHTEKDGMNIEGTVETLAGSYVSYYQNIYDHIVKQDELAVKATEARRTIKLIELAYQSSVEGKKILYKE